jgi:hypothetical protein
MRTTRVVAVSVTALVLGALVGGGLALAFQHRGGADVLAPGTPGQGVSIQHSTRAGDLLLRVSFEGGTESPGDQIVREPLFSLYGDGTVIVEAPPPTLPSPPPAGAGQAALPDLRTQRVTEAGVQAILSRAYQAGLFGPNRTYPGTTNDAPDEVFSLSAGPAHRRIVVKGGLDAPVPPDAPAGAARKRLAGLAGALLDLHSWLPSGSVPEPTPYAFDRMAVYVDTAPRDPHAPAAVGWPLTAPLDRLGAPSVTGFRCAVISGPDLTRLAPLARSAGQSAVWRSGTKARSLVFRPLVPDDPGC